MRVLYPDDRRFSLRFLSFFFCLLSVFSLRADEKSQPLDLRIAKQGFGAVAAEDLKAVLNSAAFEIKQYCPGTFPIDVYHRNDHPQTDFRRTADGRISIGLTASGTHWAQYSFQFGHEFCHTLANFSNRPGERYPLHTNFWLEESLCETASLFVLRAMSRSWSTASSSWRKYAPWLNDYAVQRMRLPEHQAGKPFRIWFQEHQSELRRDSTNRSWNTIIAIQLLPIFESDPRGWRAVSFLNRGRRNGGESLAQFLATWRAHCPQDLRLLVGKLSVIFGVQPQVRKEI